jgi:ABC-2 type transport system permease protein
VTNSTGRRRGASVQAMVVKEARELRRDRRTVAMMVVLPVVLIVVFGYAASFDVVRIPTTVVGPGAQAAAGRLPAPFAASRVDPAGGRSVAADALRDGDTPAALVTSAGRPTMLLDGTSLFTAQAALRALGAQAPGGSPAIRVEVLFNPRLKTSWVMVPGLAGMIVLFMGTVLTSLGVVRERQSGTFEQLAVMPLRPSDVFVGKVAPYFVVCALEMLLVVGAGWLLFGVPFVGSVILFVLGALLFLFVTLGIGVLVSSVSQNQGQAIQLAVMILLPQIILSGLVFPLSSMAPGVRWIGYVLPLTYFMEIARGIMLRGAGISALWLPFCYLAGVGLLIVALATLRFQRTLAPVRRERRSAATPTAGHEPAPAT